MRKKSVLIIATIVAMLFGLTQVATASISNHFRTTDGDSDIINNNMSGNGLANNWYFGVYDYNGDPSSGLKLLKGSSSKEFKSAEFKVCFNSTDSNYYINVKTGVDESKSLNIGPSDDFSFYFRNDDGSIYKTALTITPGGGDAYSFANNSGSNGSGKGSVVGDDLSAVPLPDSSILLFSGLLGLVAFGNRRKIM